MNLQNTAAALNKRKSIIINILFTATIIIMFLGFYFSIYSLINNISFQVLNSSISGVIFGLMVLYLGIRYFFSVSKLKAEVYKENSKFSWSNFKKLKSNLNSKKLKIN